MKPKKNPKIDLNRDSGLFFVIGLNLVLFLTWRALELKSYDTPIEMVINAHVAIPDLEQEAPIMENMKLPINQQ